MPLPPTANNCVFGLVYYSAYTFTSIVEQKSCKITKKNVYVQQNRTKVYFQVRFLGKYAAFCERTFMPKGIKNLAQFTRNWARRKHIIVVNKKGLSLFLYHQLLHQLVIGVDIQGVYYLPYKRYYCVKASQVMLFFLLENKINGRRACYSYLIINNRNYDIFYLPFCYLLFVYASSVNCDNIHITNL